MFRTSRSMVAFIQFSIFVVTIHHAHCEYLGKFLGKLSELHHGVSGEVYAVDAHTLHLKDFTYDGQGPAAYFYAGNTRSPGSGGFKLRDENGNPEVIRRYRKESVTLTLPEGKTLSSIKWFSVWCEEFSVNFGDVKIPRNFDYPRPRKIDALKGVHKITSDNVVVVDAQTLLIPNLSYDGEAPDAKFWVGKGPKPSPQGVRVPDENGKEVPLRRYDQKTVVLTLPGDITVFDIDYFGIWCEAFTVDFGHILIPKSLNIPPSLKMLGISPQSKLNCEVLHDDLAFEVRWAIAGDSIVLQLVAKLEPREYMSFGISGEKTKTEMIGGDVAVAWVDKETLKGFADDYYLADKSQCSGPSGSCPDNRLGENTNNLKLLNAAIVNGYSIITYQRPIKASDKFDKDIFTNEPQAVIWAIGPLNQRDEVSFHNHWTKKDLLLDFGRSPKWNCPMPETEQSSTKFANHQQTHSSLVERTTSLATPSAREQQRRRGETKIDAGTSKSSDTEISKTRYTGHQRPVPTPAPVVKRDAWHIPPIQCYEPEDGVYYAQMGPTGGKRGYSAITGHVGWGISWYINGLLIPEINLVRGKTYTFVTEGGFDPEVAAKYHPFYITDDPVGGYEYKTAKERASVKIYAGAKQLNDGTIIPVGVGRLCNWTPQGELDADDYESFGAYQRTLQLKCDNGEPGVIQFTPDKNTPNTLYYQCFTHRYLGWKINILDSCDVEASASEIQPSLLKPTKQNPEDLVDSPSIRMETRIRAPNAIADAYTNKNLTFSPINLQSSSFAQDTTLEVQTTPQSIRIDETITDRNSSTDPLPTRLQNTPFDDGSILSPPPITVEGPHRVMLPHPFLPTNNIRLYKKPVYGPSFKPLTFSKPGFHKYYEKPLYLPAIQSHPNHQSGLLLKRPLPLLLIKKVPTALSLPDLRPKVEVSPQQPSTEKEVQGTTSSPLRIVNMSSSVEHYGGYKQAINTGFNPESIVIESGFKPIVSKEAQDRNSEGPELKYESEVGVIDMTTPTGPVAQNVKVNRNHQIKQKNKEVMFIIKHTRQQRKSGLMDDDEVAEAAERVDTFYLPPSSKVERPVYNVMKPSNIDVAPGTVVTYDGKKVSGASLTVRIADRGSTALDSRTSKATELIKSSPQFGPFRGDLPPLDQTIIDVSAPQLQKQGVISRGLELPSNSYLPLPQGPPQVSTKLVRVIPTANSENGHARSLVLHRVKRAPHHTPEHTAEQNGQQHITTTPNKNSASITRVNCLILPFVSILILVFYKL